MKKRKRIPKEGQVRSELQKEIYSICPICSNEDVGHFQIHHIDENPQNNHSSNLILICPTCHSKITKGDITKDQVINLKHELPLVKSAIECLDVTVDTENCGWKQNNGFVNSFIEINEEESQSPVFNFIIINQTNTTVVLGAVKIRCLQVGGFRGIDDKPCLLKPIAKYLLPTPFFDMIKIDLENEIEIPAKRSVKFQIQPYRDWEGKRFPFSQPSVLDYTFIFNRGVEVKAPYIYLKWYQHPSIDPWQSFFN